MAFRLGLLEMLYQVILHIHVHKMYMSHPRQLIYPRKSDCLGCAVLLCLVCLFDLACVFLSSHLSFKNMYIYVYVSVYLYYYGYSHPHLHAELKICIRNLSLFVVSYTISNTQFILGKVTALGVLCCFALFVCLTLLASFFLLISHLKTCIYLCMSVCIFITMATHILTCLNEEAEYKRAWPGQSRVRLI